MPGYTLSDGLTLKNKLGATNHNQLEFLETDLVRQRLFEIEMDHGPTRSFDTEHLKAIHRYLFQDVYEWAGHTRDERVALSDGTVATEPLLKKSEGQPFTVGPAIPAALDGIVTKLRAANYLRGLPREEFAERASDAMAELNDAHPFREGNGRTQRVFMEQLAHAAGRDLDFTVVSRERMIQASIAAHEHSDASMMRRMFDEISDPARSALLRESIAGLEKVKFDWNDHYIATLAPGHAVELVFAGAAAGQFMGRTQTEILLGKMSDLPEARPEHGERFVVTATSYAPDEKSAAHGSRDIGGKTGTNDSFLDDVRVAEETANLGEASSRSGDRGKDRGR